MADEDQRTALEKTLRGLRTQRQLLEQLLTLEVVREQAGGLDAVRELLAEEGREPMDVDAALALYGVDSVGQRLVDLRTDIELLQSMLDQTSDAGSG
jgi:hypothetical protein